MLSNQDISKCTCILLPKKINVMFVTLLEFLGLISKLLKEKNSWYNNNSQFFNIRSNSVYTGDSFHKTSVY